MKKIALRCAFVVFIITVIWTLFEHVMGYNTTKHAVGEVTRQITAFVYYGTIVYAVWKVRQTHGGILSFRDGMTTSLYCSLAYSALVTIWFAVYAELINRQYQSTLLAYTKAKLESDGQSPDVIASTLKMERLSSGGSVLSYILLFSFMMFFGLLVGLIATFIMRRNTERRALNI